MTNPAAGAAIRESFADRLHRRIAGARFLVFSLFVHMVIVVVGGSVVIFRASEEAPDFVASTLGGDEYQLLPSNPTPAPEKAPEVVLPNTVTPAVTAPSASMVDVITTTAQSNSSVMTAAKMSVNIGEGELSAQLGAGAKGGGMGDAMGRLGGGSMMSFFKTKVEAKSMVVVVDVSGSMLGGLKSEKTYEVLEDEVSSLIRSLPPTARFGVVAFSRDARAFRKGLVAASSDDKSKAISWLKKMSPTVIHDSRTDEDEKQFHHGTRADLGLEVAFAMKPDVIFFASDGEPTGKKPAEILEQVQGLQANLSKPVIVNVVAYLADNGQRFMRDLAEKNAGSFREITLADVK
jgi:hypothetical protein